MGCDGCCYKGQHAEAPTIKIIEDVEILVIGDIPRAKECYDGQVMGGPGGNIIRQALGQLELDKKKTMFITACQCAVPRGKNITLKKDILNCHDKLMAIIKSIKPKSILLCGKNAYEIYANTGNVKISDLYGRCVESPELEGLTKPNGDIWEHPRTMVVFNPGAILRAPADYKQFMVQLSNFKKMVFDGDIYDPGVPTWQVIDSEDSFLVFLQHLDGLTNTLPEGHLWGCDIEATDVDYRFAQPTVIGLSFEKNKVFVLCREILHHWGAVIDLFNKKKWGLALQNGKYDKKVLWRRGIGNIKISEDTQYLAYVLDEQCKRDLGTLTKLYINVESYKFKMNQNFKAISVENYLEWKSSLIERVAFDADYTRQLAIELRKKVAEKGNESLKIVYEQLIMPCANFLARVEQNGMLIDKDYLEDLDVQYQRLLKEIIYDVEELAKYDWDPEVYMQEAGAKTAPAIFNPGSSKQMSWMVFKKLKLRPKHREGDGTGQAVLDSIENPPPLIQKVLQYRGVKKEHSTYVLGLLKRRDTDGKVRASFKPDGTATGRLSCVEPNLQNQPATNGVGNIRKAFPAPKGYIYAEIDYSGAELRWLAILSGDKNLTEVFASGRNLHDETARLIAGDNFTKKDRMGAKCVNFGIVYGITAQSISDTTGFTVVESQAIMDSWAKAYPQAWAYLSWCKRMVDEGKYIQTPFGNRRRFGLVSQATRHSLHNEAQNAPIQCSSSHTLVCVGIQEEPWLLERGVQIVNLVHDSDLLIIPAKGDIVKEVCTKFANAMSAMPKQLFGTKVKFDVDVDMGMNWGELGTYDREAGTITMKQNGEYITQDFDTWYAAASIEAEKEIYSHGWYKECQVHDVPSTGGIL